MNVSLARQVNETFDDVHETLSRLKDGISSIYHGMADFMVKMTEQINAFRTMITPYVRYFYPTCIEDSEDCFIRDVVQPSRRELDGAIDAAVQIMAGDEMINDRVTSAIDGAIGLSDDIDRILHLIDEIDVYSENMLIISTKYGQEGVSLARISSEVGAMAEKVNGIGKKFREHLASLASCRQEFGSIRSRIEVVSENYLTSMKVNLSLVFSDMVRELDEISSNVNEMLGGADELDRSMRSFVTNVQMEDVIRQRIERAIFLMNEGLSEKMHGECRPLAAQAAASICVELKNTIADQYNEIEGFCSRVGDILDVMSIRFARSAEVDESRMDAIYRRIEDLKDEYIRHIEELISDKRRLLSLCESFLVILNEFAGLFGNIEQTIKRFDALNMITRIELARYSQLSRSLGGALNSVMALPSQMKDIVERSVERYCEIKKNIINAVERYSDNFARQETVLNGCIDAMKKVSVKLYESQKYYWDISLEVGRSCDKMRAFINGECAKGSLHDASERLAGIAKRLEGFIEGSTGMPRVDAKTALERLRGNDLPPDASLILQILEEETASERSKEKVILFDDTGEATNF